MNLEVVSVAAELVGAAAVLVTLIYLALQTRDNNRVLKARAVWDAQTSFVEVNETLGDGGTVSELIYRSMSQTGTLSDYEKYLVHRFARSWFQRMEAQFALYQSGILSKEVWELRLEYVGAVLNNVIFAEYWELDKHNSMFTAAFIAAIQGARSNKSAEFLGVSPQAQR